MKKRMILFMIVFIVFQFSTLIHGAIPVEERAALIALYNSTDGDNWKNNSGWKTPPLNMDGFAMPGTEGNWYGVTVSTDHVTTIKLAGNQLKGFIPTQIGNLSKLQYLDLGSNILIGGIPLELDEIKSLKSLFLDSIQTSDNNYSELVDFRHLEVNRIKDDKQVDGKDVAKSGLPDLAPYQPAGFSDIIIISNVSGTETDNIIYANQIVYIDYGAKNIGTADITGGFYVDIIDDTTGVPILYNGYWSSPLYAGYYFKGRDHPFVFFQEGWHTIRLKLDVKNNVYESNETNNEYTRLVYINPVLPSVTTNPVSSIESNSATCGGNVLLNGGTTVTARGVCWSTSSNPTTSNSRTIDGSGTGNFTSYIYGLNPGTTYYVRAYATNRVGTAYGENENFTTNPISTTIPTVNTSGVYSITSNSAVCGGNVTFDGGATVTARGVCWSLTSYPSIYNSKTIDGSGTGSFTSYIYGLNPETTYYVRAYATNSNGTEYGSNVRFTTNAISSTPTVTTNAVSSITSTSALVGGNVTKDGGAAVTSRGVCWSTSLNPTTSNFKTIDGSGTGSFTSNITGLSANTTYYVRAYATNSNGTSYGTNVSFKTNPPSPNIPTVTTNSVSSITSSSAVCGGNVISDGGATVTARGVCWSTSLNPTTSNFKTIDGSGTGSFTSNITGLSANTNYYVRAYATNSNGTSYGSNVSITTNPALPTIPTVTTSSVSSITSSSAVCGGIVTSDGGSAVTARGVCWNTSLNPTISNFKTTDGSGTGNFASNITGLSKGTTYYVRAYATNNNGTAFGSNVTFTTLEGNIQSLKVGNLTFYADSITSSGNVYTLSGNVNIDNLLWFTDNIIYTAGSDKSGTMLSKGFPFVKLSKGNQYIFTAHDLVYNINGDMKKLTPLTSSADYLYSIYLSGIPLSVSTDPIIIKEDGIFLSGKLSIGPNTHKLCVVNVELLLKSADKLYLEKASLSSDTSSLIPGIKVTSIRLNFNGEEDKLTGSANLEFPFLGLKEINAAISVKPGCIDGFRIAVALKKSIKIGATSLTINGFTLEVDSICTPARFKIFFGGDLGIVGISPDVFLLDEMGLGYEHPYRLNLEGGTVKFLKYPVANLSGYIDASNDINKAGAGIYGNIDFGGFYVAEVDLKLLINLLKFNGSANGALQIPDFTCDNWKCKIIKALITHFITLPYKISKQEMDIEIWKNNGNWTGSLKGMTSIFGLQLAAELSYSNGKLHFSIGKNFDDMLKIFRNNSDYRILTNSVEQSISLPSATKSIIFSAGGNIKLPQIYLKSPKNEVISPNNVESFDGITYIENDNTRVSLFMLKSAAAGKWTIGVNNLSSEQVKFEILAKRILPQTSFLQVAKSGNKLNIKAAVIPAQNDITVSFYFSERSSGGTGNLIAENLNAASGIVSTVWETSAIATGTYYIYAKTYDNLNAPVLTYYNPAIVIDNSNIQAPQNLRGTTSGDTVELNWTPSQSLSVAGYKVLYTDEPNTGGYKYQKSTILNNQSTIGGLNLNKVYRFCVVAFDENGGLSMESNSFTNKVSNGTPEIDLSPGNFYFGGNTNGVNSGTRNLLITNKGSGSLEWIVSTNQNWLSCAPTSGIGDGKVTVSVNLNGLDIGNYTGIITVSDPDASNSPQTAAVVLNIYYSNQTDIPFGEFATPINGSTVNSSIAVTGWVLDDIGVASVKLYGYEGKNKFYIGDAVFVEGARPDVEQAYPTYPNNYKAGWGYMLLTNFLPNNGNGTFTLEAVATDMEGNQVTLGTKRITVDNATAFKPFGAIDSPSQGGIASGSNYRNWGWVLTPPPNMIPNNGSTINVWVDGINLGHPAYNIHRSDISSLFPGYANSNGPGGYFDFDTTAFNNGVHTIQWTASDSGGNSDGIGSRYFTIQNTGSSQSTLTATQNTTALRYRDLTDVPISSNEPVIFKKGYNDSDIAEDISPDTKGIVHIQIREMERIEVQVSQAGYEVQGYMNVCNRLGNLPIGSTIDKITGKFSWIPGPGFVGTYSLVFVETNEYGEKSKKNILVTIVPKFSVK
jgi:hypothetical protein